MKTQKHHKRHIKRTKKHKIKKPNSTRKRNNKRGGGPTRSERLENMRKNREIALPKEAAKREKINTKARIKKIQKATENLSAPGINVVTNTAVTVAVNDIIAGVNDVAIETANKMAPNNSAENKHKIIGITGSLKETALKTAFETFDDDSEDWLHYLFGSKTNSEKKDRQRLDEDDPVDQSKKPDKPVTKPLLPAKVNDAPLANVNDAPLENVNDTPLANVNDAPLANINDATLANVNDAPPKNVNDAPLANVNDAPLANVNDAEEEFWDDLMSNPDKLRAQLASDNEAVAALQRGVAAKQSSDMLEEIESMRKKRAASREIMNVADALAQKIQNDAKEEAKNIRDAAMAQKKIVFNEIKRVRDEKTAQHIRNAAEKNINEARQLAANIITSAQNDAKDIMNAASNESENSFTRVSPSNIIPAQNQSPAKSQSSKGQSPAKSQSSKRQSSKRQSSAKRQLYAPNSYALLGPKEASFSYRPNSYDLLAHK